MAMFSVLLLAYPAQFRDKTLAKSDVSLVYHCNEYIITNTMRISAYKYRLICVEISKSIQCRTSQSVMVDVSKTVLNAQLIADLTFLVSTKLLPTADCFVRMSPIDTNEIEHKCYALIKRVAIEDGFRKYRMNEQTRNYWSRVA